MTFNSSAEHRLKIFCIMLVRNVSVPISLFFLSMKPMETENVFLQTLSDSHRGLEQHEGE